MNKKDLFAAIYKYSFWVYNLLIINFLICFVLYLWLYDSSESITELIYEVFLEHIVIFIVYVPVVPILLIYEILYVIFTKKNKSK